MNSTPATDETPAVAPPIRLLLLLTGHEGNIENELRACDRQRFEFNYPTDPDDARQALTKREHQVVIAHESFYPLLASLARHLSPVPTILVTSVPSLPSQCNSDDWVFQSLAENRVNRRQLDVSIPAAARYGDFLADSQRAKSTPRSVRLEKLAAPGNGNGSRVPSIGGSPPKTNSRDRLMSALTENASMFVGSVDETGCITEISGSLGRKCGIDPDTSLGLRLDEVLPECRQKLPTALSGGNVCFQASFPDAGEVRYVELRLVSDDAGGALFFGRDITERRRIEEQLAGVADAERQRIGMEIHDGLGQLVTGMTCLSSALAAKLRELDPASAAEADTICQIARQTLNHTRAFSHGLGGMQLADTPIDVALSELCGHLRDTHQIECESVVDEACRLDSKTSLHLFRIAQEAVSNAIRHGQATNVRIALRSDESGHRMEIRDNGVGIDPSHLREQTGVGLSSMRCRCNLIGGSLNISSKVDGGTSVVCVFP